MQKVVLIAGASGLVGYAVQKHFTERGDAAVIALSRRPPRLAQPGVKFLPVDLSDRSAVEALCPDFREVTHLVYAALYERPQLVAGWLEKEQIETNAKLFRNLLDCVCENARGLRHVAVLQGTKAYGIHVRTIPVPAREDRDEAYDVPNFYWEQEDHLRTRGKASALDWTIFRPQGIFGESIGSAMNVIVALGIYGALLKDDGEPLYFPGGDPNIMEATDSDILARAIAWAGDTPAASGQTFNITNGDVFKWQQVWPAIADALGMQPGEPRPMSLAAEMPARARQWDIIRARHGLTSPGLEAFAGLSFQFADSLFGYGDPTRAEPGIVSTVKLRRAGFVETMDTEAMLRKWFSIMQRKLLFPSH